MPKAPSGTADTPTDSAAWPDGLSPLRLQLRNRDLKFVGEPLLVGHYRSSRITGAERVVDALIGGQMAQSLRLGQYPDAPGTHQVFVNLHRSVDDAWQLPRPHSVVVVGLGEEGELRHSALAMSVRLAVLALAQRLLELQGAGCAPHFDLAATLLGSGGAGITAGAAAQQVAQGVRDANVALHQLNLRQIRAREGANEGLTHGRRKGQGDSTDGQALVRPWPQAGTLHLVELYADRAAEAWRALQALSQALPGQFDLAPDVVSGLGALRRPLDGGYRGADYDFIRAATRAGGPDGVAIDYTLDTQRARSEAHGQATQMALVRTLVARASQAAAHDPQLGRTLFQLLVPPGVAPIFGASSDLVIELDDGTAGIPWELLEARPQRGATVEARPWAIRCKLLRKLRTDRFASQVPDAGAEAGVLVVGDPACDRQRYPDLPGARDEALAVAQRLRAVLPPAQVQALVRSAAPDDPGPDAAEVVKALLSRDWRVLHVAGHGEAAAGPEPWPDLAGPAPGPSPAPMPDQAATVDAATGAGPATAADAQVLGHDRSRGVVLDNGSFLGPRELAAMSVVPQLVFLNCCHLGARADTVLQPADRGRPMDWPLWAASLAQQLIGLGVRCVVVAGWAVEDRPAQVFAETFYAALLRPQGGARFIDAVAEAREQAWRAGGNTWAAYQCYGDPDWTFHPRGSVARAAPSLAARYSAVSSPPQLTLALETLVVQCQVQGADRAEQALRVAHLATQFGPAWGAMGAVAEAFGLAWAAVGNRAQALAWYQRAVAAEDGSASLRAAEQWAVLLVQQVGEQIDTAEQAARPWSTAQAHAAQTALDQARGLLQGVLRLAPNAARHSLLGGLCKRQLMLHRLRAPAAAAGQAQTLSDMVHHYRQAHDLARTGLHADGASSGAWQALVQPGLNLVAAHLAGRAPGARVALPRGLLASVRAALLRQSQVAPDFWCVAGLEELALYQALAAGDARRRLGQVAQGLAVLQARMPSLGHWATLCDQMRFVLHPLLQAPTQAGPEGPAAQALMAQLRGYAGRAATGAD